MKSSIHGPYWLRAHKDWRFWVVVGLMLVAMAAYVATNNLAWRPRVQPAAVTVSGGT